MKNIIIASTQLPFYGGSSTVAYAMIKYYKTYTNNNIFGLFFNKSKGNVDPHNLRDIYLIRTSISIYDKYKLSDYSLEKDITLNEINRIKNKMSNPDFIICVGLHTSSYMRELYSNAKIFLITSGLTLFNTVQLNIGISEAIKIKSFFDDARSTTKGKQELEDINSCNLIIPNSPDMIKYYNIIYSDFKDKIYHKYLDTSGLVSIFDNHDNTIINNEKNIDILVISSNLTRPEKNNKFLIPILKNSKFDKYKKCVIGDDYDMFKDIPNSICTGLINHNDVYDYYEKSKLLLIPSFYESAGNVVREGLPYKCITLLSCNVGFHEKFPEFCVCKSLSSNEWSQKIEYILENYNDLINEYNINFDNDFTLNDLLQL